VWIVTKQGVSARIHSINLKVLTKIDAVEELSD